MIAGFLGFLLAVAAIIIATTRSNKLTERVQRLEAELTLLKRRSDRMPVESAPPIPTSATFVERKHVPLPVPEVATAIAEEPSPVPKPRSRMEWEAMVGGKLFNRIGALALIIGVGFFLKYAFDNNLISEPVRVLLGAAVGIALLFVAHLAHRKKFEIFAQGLVGAGLAILYLSDYAAFNFYQLIHPAAAFALMAAITVLAFQQALRYDSLAISLLGWAGGFLTPFLVGSKEASEAGLFGYFVVLDAGLLAVVLRKKAWAAIMPLTMAGTWIIYFYWWGELGSKAGVSPGFVVLTVLFLTIFWAFFHAMDIQRALAPSQGRAVFAHIMSVLNAILYFAGMAALFNRAYPDWQAGVTLLIGAGYLFTLWSVRERAENVTCGRFALTAALFLVIATVQQYSDFALAMLWSAEAVILAAIGLWRKQVHLWSAALGILILAFFAFLQTPASLKYEPVADFLLLFNVRAAALLTLAASCAVIGLSFKLWPEREKSVTSTVMHGSWLVLVFILLTVETLDFFRTMMSAGLAEAELGRLQNLQQLSVSGVWLLYSIVLLSLGLWRRQTWLRIAAMVLFGVTIGKAFFFDLSFLETLYRIVSFIGLGVILVAVSYFYQRYKTVLFEAKSTES